MKKTCELRVIPVGELKPAEYNPRKKLKPGDKEYEKIKNSIEEFGFADPLVVNKDMTIIGGHQRLTVGMALGYTEVPCAVVDVDKVREKALNIALNKITGAWDETMLADLLADIQASDFDLGKTGFEPPEIETLFNSVHDKDVKEDDFDVEDELKKPCFSKAGDIWHLGRHKVICGDSTLPETYAALLEGVKVNMILTDPPYNVDVEETAGKIMNDNMSKDDFYKFLLAAYTQMHEAIADDGSIYVFHADTEGLNFFANGAAPSGVLEYPTTLNDPEKLRNAWQSQFGGSENSGKTPVLENGLHYVPIGIKPQEAQFLETRKFQIDEIARIFRIPPHMVGDLDKSSFSNIEQQSLEFVKYSLDPWVIRWEQSLARALFSLDEKGKLFFKFNVEGLLRGDYASRMQGYSTARQNGWMSANDIRELENLDRIPAEEGGDLYLVNGNMLPLNLAGAAYVEKDIMLSQEEQNEEDKNSNAEENEKVLEVDESGRRRVGTSA